MIVIDTYNKNRSVRLKTVSKSEPCPICGHRDWCYYMIPQDPVCPGERIIFCNRETSITDFYSTSGVYKFITVASQGAHGFMEESIYNETRRGYGKSSNISVKGVKPEPIPISKPKEEKQYYIPPRSNADLDPIYRSFLKKLSLNRDHYRYLIREGWSKELILHHMIRSVPVNGSYNGKYMKGWQRKNEIANELVEEFGDLKGVPGFYINKYDNWTFTVKSGLLIPIVSYKNNIFRLKVRRDHVKLDEKGKEENKYGNFTSYYGIDDGEGENVYKAGSRSGSHAGLLYDPNVDDLSYCIVIEGEKKAIVAHEEFHVPVISLPGVNSSMCLYDKLEELCLIEYLKVIGIKKIVIAFDADKAVNDKVLYHEEFLARMLHSEKFDVFTAEWNLYFGKGLDDILKWGIYPSFQKWIKNEAIIIYEK